MVSTLLPLQFEEKMMNVQGVSKKRYFFDFRLIYVLETGFNFFACDFELKFLALPFRHSNYIHPESKLPLNIVIKYMEVCKDATAQASHLKTGITRPKWAR